MNPFEAALAHFVGTGPVMGQQQPIDIDRFRRDLNAVASRNAKLIFLPFGATLFLFVLAVLGFVLYRSDPLKVSAVLGVAGVSIPLLIRLMVNLWSLKVQSDTLLVLASTLDREIMLSIAKTILKNMTAKVSVSKATA